MRYFRTVNELGAELMPSVVGKSDKGIRIEKTGRPVNICKAFLKKNPMADINI